MSNSIDSMVDGSIQRLMDRRAGTASREGHPAAASPEKAGSADHVNLTGRAQDLQAASAELAKTPEFDSARVETLKQAISSGSYEVNAERIAEKLLATDEKLP